MSEGLRRLHLLLPADSFTVVMATGIVSVAAFDNGYALVSYALAAVAVLVFAGLVVLIGFRLHARRQFLRGDLRDPTQAFGLYAFVAACDVIDARLGLVGARTGVLIGLGAAALVAWFLLVPAAWTALRSTPRRRLRSEARGSWLLAAVATQSLAVISAELTKLQVVPPLLAVAFSWWVLGLVAYLGVAALIVWRLVRERIGPEDVTPDSWVLMGALAIATLASGTMLSAAESLHDASWLEGVLAPGTLAVWALGTAWIPALVAGEAWRLWRSPRIPRYERSRWATVFPLGMYSAATYVLGQVFGHQRVLEPLSVAFFWIAFATWCLTAYGLARVGYRTLRAYGQGTCGDR